MSHRTLTAAIDSNDLAALESLLAAGADPDAGPRSALVAALENERLDRGVWVERLLERGADPNRLSDDTWPLTVAIGQGLTGVALRLLERGASANVREGASPLGAALKARDAELVKALLARGADPRALDPASDKLPLALAIEHEQFEIAELLLDEGADPRDANEYSSPLGAAIAVGSIVWVERLLRLGADAGHRDYNRLGLLAGAASRSRSPEMLRALYRLGFGTAEAHVEALWAAAVFRDDAAVVATLLELGGVPSQGDLLHVTSAAVVNGHRAVTELLLRHLVDKNACTDAEWSLANGTRAGAPNTLLGRAVLACDLALVELLLQAGADPTVGLPVPSRSTRGPEPIPVGTDALGIAELCKRQLVKAREAHLHPDLDRILARLSARRPSKTGAAKKTAKAAAEAAPTDSSKAVPAYKRAIDTELSGLARGAGADEDALRAALATVEPAGGPWSYLERVVTAIRNPLLRGDVPRRLAQSLLGRLLTDPFDGDGPPEVCDAAPDETEGADHVVYLDCYPKRAQKPLREGEIVAASGADVWIVEPLADGDARFSHAHPEGFSILAKGAVELVKREVAAALAAPTRRRSPGRDGSRTLRG